MTMTEKATWCEGLLERLRAEVGARGLHAYVVPSCDAHASEYVSERHKRLLALSGVASSAGVALVPSSSSSTQPALFWTDARYWLQADAELAPRPAWQLMRQGADDVPGLAAWLASSLPAGARVGVDPALLPHAEAAALRAAAASAGAALVPVRENLVDACWPAHQRPQRAARRPLAALAPAVCGTPAHAKLAALRARMAEAGADAYVASALDDVAWLLNVRGNDVPCLPVVEAYCVVHSAARGSAVELFVHPGVVGDGNAALALGVTAVRDIGDVAERVRELAESEGYALWTDPAQTSMALTDAAGPRAVMLPSPLHRMKAIKCREEIAGMRQAHVLDGIATIRWLARLEAAAAAGESMSEFGVTMELEKLRGELDGYAGPSFETIAGFGPNGAIIHYEPHQKGSTQVDRSSLLLLDFGGQYLCGGTTDTSRTIHLGEPTAEQRRHYTIVLKSHIALATAVFPAETSPAVLDSIAREVMWRHGLDYRHGTGHGVGALLSVHELPVLNGSRTEPRIDAGMTITMEPGLYLEGKYGIRIENVGLVVESRHKRLDSKKAFLEFEMLTAVPYAAKLIDTKLLTADEIRFVNDYHRRVASEMAPLLSHDPVALSWLLRETSPIA